MSSSIVDCGHCGEMFDCGDYTEVSPRGAPTAIIDPFQCPHCGYIRERKEGGNPWDYEWVEPPKTEDNKPIFIPQGKNRQERRANISINRKIKRGLNFTKPKKKRK